MPEIKEPIDKVQTTRDIIQVDFEQASDAFVEGDINITPLILPTISENQLLKGLGGKYLNQVKKTTSFTTTSLTYVDVTNLSITATIKNRRVLLMFSGQISNDTNAESTILTFDIDGVTQGDLISTTFSEPAGAQQLILPASMVLITGILIGSHTFKVQIHSTNSSTAYINFFNSPTTIFNAIELS